MGNTGNGGGHNGWSGEQSRNAGLGCDTEKSRARGPFGIEFDYETKKDCGKSDCKESGRYDPKKAKR